MRAASVLVDKVKGVAGGVKDTGEVGGDVDADR